MAYSSDSDLLKEMSTTELARITGVVSGSNYNAERTEYARVNAEALIDAYLKSRYTVPLGTPADPIIKKLSIDLTVANLHEYYYGKSSVSLVVSDRRNNAMKILRGLQEGTINLQSSSPGTCTPPAIISNVSGPRIFSEEMLGKYFD